MTNILGWVAKIPFWLLVFVAFMQIASIPPKYRDIDALQESIDQCKRSPGFESFVNSTEQLIAKRQQEITTGLIIGPILAALAFLNLWLRKNKSAAELEQQHN